MKRILLLLLAIAVVGLLAWGILHHLQAKAKEKREAAYEASLQSYAQALKPGMTRKQVEDYFQARNITYLQECCVLVEESSTRHSWDDLVKVGEEEKPWYCSEHYVYIAFRFADYGEPEAKWQFKDNDLDTLKSVTIYHQLGGCL